MKSRVKKRVIALMLCMVMVLSSGISTLAEGDAGTPEATEEVSSTNDESAVNTEPDTAVAEESQSRSNTAVETETAAEENAPAEAEAQPKTAEAAPAENTEADAAAQTPVEEIQTEETKDNAADAQSTEQSAENGEAVQEETTEEQGNDTSESDVQGSDSGKTPAAAVARASSIIQDLSGKNITWSYGSLSNSESGDIDITWKRSTEGQAKTYTGKVDAKPWDWSFVSNIGLGITEENLIWDGSRLNNYDQVDHNFSENTYLSDSTVTALDGTLYDSATWVQKTGGDNTTIHRFQGTFSIGTDNPNNFDYTLKQVVDEDRIYINDNIFVFVYPVGETITNQNYMDYLAFWTGTVGGDNDDKEWWEQKDVAYFHGRSSTPAYWDVGRNNQPNTLLGKVTNGWYCDAVTDNIGNIIYNAYNEDNGNTEFVIDVFAEDFAAGGGMYRLQLNKTPTTRHTISFMKVDEDNTDVGLPGAEFALSSDNGTRYTSTNTNGLITFSAPAGTYTMTETVTPAGYEENNGKTWTVVIGNNGQLTITDNQTSQSAPQKKFNGTSYYYITNKSLITGKLEFTKTKADGETPLSGATFTLYEPDGTTVVGTASSNDQGKVVISNIPIGTGYILKETEVPDTYVLSDDTWIVNVDSQGNVTMYLSTDSDQTPVSVIPNYTESEELLKGLENNKTVTSEDEANRVFEVLLNAYSTGSTTIEGMSDIDVMLVLDKSTSMKNYSRKANLESAVRSFLSQMVEQKQKGNLSNSRVAIVEFSGSVEDKTEGWIQDTDEIKGLSETYTLSVPRWGDGTSMAYGLKTAYDNYYNGRYSYNSNNKQIIITLTDGENNRDENGYEGWYHDYNQDALDEANKIRHKVEGITFYGIGLGIESNSSGGSFLQELIPNAIDKQLWFVSDNAGGDKLSQIFEDIFHSSTEADVYKNAKVIDYIDSRFQYSYTENGEWKVYTDEYIQNYQATNDGAGIELDNGGVLKYDTEKKCQYIEWTQDIGAKETEDEFKKNFYIKAKEDFIGGNMVPTNGPESGVYLDDTTIKYFPQPSVNVAPLSLELTGKEITVYKGDSIDPAEFISELTSSLKVTELDGQTKVTAGIPTIPTLTDEQKAALATGNEVVIGQSGTNEYVYPGTTDPIGYFKYTYEVEETPTINLAEHEMTVSGEDVAIYSLEIQFVPYSVAERDGLDELGAEVQQPATNGGTELVLTDPTTGDKLTADAKYVVDVISGEIQITKELKENASSDQSFTFNITKDGTEFATIVININEGNNTATYEGEELEDLSRGTYVVTEEMQGYAVTNIVIGADTDCYHSDLNIEQGTVKFHLGQNTEDVNVINEEFKHIGGGVLGTVTYTNDQAVSSWQIIKRSESNHTNYLEGAVFELDSGKDTYYGMSNESGIIEWFVKNPMDSDFDKETDKLETGIPKGTYQFSELRAPSGYAVSGETWEIEFASLGKISSIISSKDQDKNMVDDVLNGGQTAIFYFDNEMLYELPEAGGTGIYWYMLGGVLLMMAGSLLVYKKRRGEVLRRK